MNLYIGWASRLLPGTVYSIYNNSYAERIILLGSGSIKEQS
ncbi:hypothetical protein [Echinicola salinicaeni]|nr:hypothetical protein [Echinicola salinicaeni]